MKRELKIKRFSDKNDSFMSLDDSREHLGSDLLKNFVNQNDVEIVGISCRWANCYELFYYETNGRIE